MHYKGIYSILDGIVNDCEKIKKVINKMEMEINANDKNYENKSVSLGHNESELIYKLNYGTEYINGRIPLEKIYEEVRNKKEDEYEDIIYNLIEVDAVTMFFS